MCKGIKDCPCNKKYLLNFEAEPFEADTEFDEEQADALMEFDEGPELIEPETDNVTESEVKRRSRRVRYFTCNNAERSQIENALQMSVPVDALRSAVDAAAGRAVSWLLNAARALQRPRSNNTKTFFREAFKTTPEFVPTWRPPSASWRDRGELVRIRLMRTAKILDGGWIRYFCWGSQAHCPECTGAPSTYYACSSWGRRYVICLGQSFWIAWRDGDAVTLAATLLHEALHIYFGRTVAHGERGPYGNAFCYERFVLRINGIPLPQATVNGCP